MNSGHPYWLEHGKKIGRPLTPVPFPAVAYARETGQNISDWTGVVSRKRRIMRELTPVIRDDRKLREEFGLPLRG